MTSSRILEFLPSLLLHHGLHDTLDPDLVETCFAMPRRYTHARRIHRLVRLLDDDDDGVKQHVMMLGKIERTKTVLPNCSKNTMPKSFCCWSDDYDDDDALRMMAVKHQPLLSQ